MQFVNLREFYDYIHANFDIPRGEITLLKIEETGAEDVMYLFLHGKRYHREGTEPKSDEKELTGVFVLYSYTFNELPEQEMVKAIQDWYGQRPLRVISTHKTESGTDMVVQVPEPKEGFWWNI